MHVRISHRFRQITLSFAFAALALAFSGCITKRTVYEGGQKVEEKFIVKKLGGEEREL